MRKTILVTFKKVPKVKQDVPEAARLYRLAAAQGHDIAQNNLAVMFAGGRGVAQDTAESVRLFASQHLRVTQQLR